MGIGDMRALVVAVKVVVAITTVVVVVRHNADGSIRGHLSCGRDGGSDGVS